MNATRVPVLSRIFAAQDAPSLAQVYVDVAPPARGTRAPVINYPIVPISDISEMSVGLDSLASIYPGMRDMLHPLFEHSKDRTGIRKLFECFAAWVSTRDGGYIQVRGNCGGRVMNARSTDSLECLPIEIGVVARLRGFLLEEGRRCAS